MSGERYSTGPSSNSPLKTINHNEKCSDDNQRPGDSVGNRTNDSQIPGPVGLKALCDICRRLYPDQPNPLQVTAKLKYWLGGPDPLDYISMYFNPGDNDMNIPPHWHYISFGLSDLHGDGRVHPAPDRVLLQMDKSQVQSGYGIELSFRLRHDGASNTPATWPAALLQHLARYIFRTGNKLCIGDHVSWHTSLDNASSKIKHMLVAEDKQLGLHITPLGSVHYLQIVGCTNRELRAAQRTSGNEILKQLSQNDQCGGEWLITDMKRNFSLPVLKEAKGCRYDLPSPPLDLAGVSAPVQFYRWVSKESERKPKTATSKLLQENKLETKMSTDSITNSNGHNPLTLCASAAMSTDSFEMSSVCAALKQVLTSSYDKTMEENLCEKSTDSNQILNDLVYMDGVHLFFNLEGASLIPLAMRGRLLHGHHFTWRGVTCAVTFVTRHTRDTIVTTARPYAHTRDRWLQIYIPDWLAQDIAAKTANLEHILNNSSSEEENDIKQISAPQEYPITFTWPQINFKISVYQELE